MSCIPESTWIVYVDGELSAEDVRRVEAHLVGCERCRRTVLALREEGRLLADVLHERPRAAPVRTLAPAPVRGLVLGMPLSLALGGVAAGVLGVILELHLPSGAAWLNPARFFGVNQMIFDVIFAVRDRAPGLVEFGLAVATTASLAGIVTFLAGALLRRLSGPGVVGLLALIVLAWSPAARAALDLRNESVHVREGETVEGTLVGHGESVRIEGRVDGNLLVFTERLTIRGTVDGNVIGAAQEIEISGLVMGSLLVVGEHVRVDGEVLGNAVTGCDRFTLASGARAARDLGLFADSVVIEGAIGRDLIGLVDLMELRGAVGRDVEVFADRLSVQDGAKVVGGLRAHVRDAKRVEIDPGAVISGETETRIVRHGRASPLERFTHAHFYVWLLVRAVAAFGVGVIAYALIPGIFAGSLPSGRAFFTSLGLGLALVLLAPFALVLTALTLVGIPVALIAAGVLLCAVYLAGIVVAALIGIALTKPRGEGIRDFGLALLVGLLVLTVATNLPFLGPLVRIVVVLVGLGMLAQRAVALRRARQAPAL